MGVGKGRPRARRRGAGLLHHRRRGRRTARGPITPSPTARSSAGEPVVIDMGARYEGYSGDLTRTIVVGEPDEQFRRVYDVVLRAMRHAEEVARPGMTERRTRCRGARRDRGGGIRRTPSSMASGTASACKSMKRRARARKARMSSRPACPSPSSRAFICPNGAACASKTSSSSRRPGIVNLTDAPCSTSDGKPRCTNASAPCTVLHAGACAHDASHSARSARCQRGGWHGH